jgi:hypothetical protein
MELQSGDQDFGSGGAAILVSAYALNISKSTFGTISWQTGTSNSIPGADSLNIITG